MKLGLLERLSDTTASVIAISMLIIALIIRLTSSGPVLFRQRRYGLDGQEIEVWKFRTISAGMPADG